LEPVAVVVQADHLEWAVQVVQDLALQRELILQVVVVVVTVVARQVAMLLQHWVVQVAITLQA
jgi:hypothetical protein